MTDLEFRNVSLSSLTVREEGDDMTLSGCALPYGQVIEVSGYKESFERGAFGDYDGSALLFSSHDHQAGGLPIGRITKGEDREEGYFIEARISATDKGREIHRLLKDGVLDKLSVGFRPIEARLEDGVTVRTKAQLREVSVVPFPAYADAAITAVRSADSSAASAVDSTEKKGSHMTDVTADVVEVRSEIEDLSRRFTVLEERGAGNSGASAVRFNSLGEFVKGLLNRSSTKEDAEMLTRAYTGAVVADNGAQRPAWIDRDIKLVAQNRDILEFFSKEALPSEGMTVTYPVNGVVTGDVAVQATEGADLTYIEVSTATGSSNVLTYGAYSSLSFQLIERNSVAYLNKVLQAQKLSYAKVTNSAVRTLLGNTPAAYNQATVAFAGKDTAKAWISAAANGSALITQNSTGLSADAWIMGKDQFLQLATIVDSSGRPVFALNGDGSNTIGNANLIKASAVVAGLPVLVDFGLSGTDSFIVSREALTVLEDGAKYLQDQNIINLTKDFSIYGYMALTKNDVKGITRVTHPTA